MINTHRFITAIILSFFILEISSLEARETDTPKYKIVALGTPSGLLETNPTGINDSGDICGWGEIAKKDALTGRVERGYNIQYFILQDNKYRLLPLKSIFISTDRVFGINDNGIVIGSSKAQAFFWHKSKATMIPPSASGSHTSSALLSINKHNDMVGYIREKNVAYGILYRDNALRKIQTLPGMKHSKATAINSSRTVAGYCYGPSSPAEKRTSISFLWKNGKMVALPRFSGEVASQALDINDEDMVVGWVEIKKGNRSIRRAALWHKGKAIQLGDFPGTEKMDFRSTEIGIGGRFSYFSMQAKSINNDGTVIGNTTIKLGCVISTHSFLWANGRIWDVNKLIPQKDGWEIFEVNDINNRGQIIGTGRRRGEAKAFLMTPISDPKTQKSE